MRLNAIRVDLARCSKFFDAFSDQMPRTPLVRSCGNRLKRAAFSKIRGFRLPVYLPAMKSLLNLYERYASLAQLSRRRSRTAAFRAHGEVDYGVWQGWR